jgi:MATE family multidrug resistance protein
MPESERTHRIVPTSPLAEAVIAADVEHEDPNADVSAIAIESHRALAPEHSMASSFRRPSFVQPGTRPAMLLGSMVSDASYMTPEQRQRLAKEERNLLRDNNIIPPKAVRTSSEDNIGSRLAGRLSLPGLRKSKSTPEEEADDGVTAEPSEVTPLIGGRSSSGDSTPDIDDIDKKWEEAVLAGMIQTTWQREAKVLASYSAPLIVTFVLQYSLTVASVFTVGHIGKVELGAVSLASSK